jgi:hypothetical protein
MSTLVQSKTYITGNNVIFVSVKNNLPIPSGGIITLLANYTYLFTAVVDLTGDRLLCASNTAILGFSSENCRIKSTGLSAGTALITSAWSLPIRNITIEHGTAISLDATANVNQALDWFGVNFTDCATVGTITTYNNFIATDCAFLNSQGLTFDGTIATIGFISTIFDNTTSGTSIIIPATLTLSRRLRIIYSSFISEAGETALNVSASATIPVEGYILDTINFSSGGTYIAGVQYNDNKSLFVNCKGISNSGNIGQYYMTANATTTTIGVINTFVKVAGTTITGSFIEKFTHTDNRLTYNGALTGFYKITSIVSLTSGNNNVVQLRVGLNGTTSVPSTSQTTTSGAGKSENVTCSDIVSLNTNDYIEIFTANTTGTNNITVSEVNVIIERLN